jgi:ribosome maturation factor RimP
MKESQIAGVLTPILAQFGLELEAVEIIPAGKRRLLRVVVDGDGPDGTGPLLDEIADASKAASAALDSADVPWSEPSPRATSALAQERRSAGHRATG